MKTILALGILAAAMTFCGLGDRLKGLSGNSAPANGSAPGPEPKPVELPAAEKATLTAAQQSIQDSSTEQKWDDQGISFKLPASWKKMSVGKESFSYGSGDGAFLIATISTMPGSFPADTSLKATYDSSLEKLKQGKYEKARMLEIDGIRGVEWIEAMPEDKSGPRRHQWIAFRNYQGENQQLNIIVSTKGANFDKHRDDFPAVLYSIKIPKG
jgi:hypothetical protein